MLIAESRQMQFTVEKARNRSLAQREHVQETLSVASQHVDKCEVKMLFKQSVCMAQLPRFIAKDKLER